MYSLRLENAEDGQAAELFRRLMSLWHGRDIRIAADGADGADVSVRRDPSLKAEGFRLVCDGKTAVVHGNGKSGVTHGLSALLGHYAARGLGPVDLTEAPRLPFRGVHLFLPAKDNLDGFKRIIDMLAFLKLNTLILEVGGGMEYERHPEINRGWERFCAQVNAFPGGPKAFQAADAFWKNCTHTELGGGSFLPKAAVRKLVEYAKGYGMDVIPELPMYSHAYYLTSAHPRLAERAEDHCPDTICPCNEDAYTLYFELAEEVIEVFHPQTVSIGHDEVWTIGKCDACRPHGGHELLARSVNRLHGFYTDRGVKVAMWCEKLQRLTNYFTGKPFGGVEREYVNPLGRKWFMPATHDAIRKIPKDILLMDWQYGWSWESQDEAGNNGFRQVFGNFHGEATRGWERRLSSPCVIGGETSSWCLADERALGHDGIIGDFWYSALMLWDADFDENRHGEYALRMREELPLLREALRGRRSAAASLRGSAGKIAYAGESVRGAHRLPSAALPERGVWGGLKRGLPAEMNGAPLGEMDLVFFVGEKVERLVFVHTCLGNFGEARYGAAEWCPAVYSVRYADGESIFVPVRFGVDIGHVDMDFGRKPGYRGVTREDPGGFGTDAEKCPDPPLYEFNRPWKNSLLYSASPFFFGKKAAYMQEWENPRPEAAVERVFALNAAKTREEQAILFCVAAVLRSAP